MPRSLTLVVSALMVVVVHFTAHAAPPEFRSAGLLKGSDGNSTEAWGISADGSRGAGFGSLTSSTSMGFWWVIEGGTAGIGDISGGGVNSVLLCISGDGKVFGGVGEGNSGPEAFRYTTTGGSVPLGGTVPNGVYGSAVFAASSSGSVVVGMRERVSGGVEAAAWNNTTLQPLGFISGTPAPFISIAYGVSGNAGVIVGGSDSPNGYEAFRWTAATGMIGLGDLHVGSTLNSEAHAVSRDGSTIVGIGTTAGTRSHAFRWSQSSGMEDLGDLPGGSDFSDALGVSADGSVIVGKSDAGGLTAEAFIWDRARGMQPLKSVLQGRCGLDLTGWILLSATAVSDNGRTVVGYGINPLGKREAWAAILPCPADLNNDGFVDAIDLDIFIGAWVVGGLASDYNADSFSDAIDYDLFIADWFTPCD